MTTHNSKYDLQAILRLFKKVLRTKAPEKASLLKTEFSSNRSLEVMFQCFWGFEDIHIILNRLMEYESKGKNAEVALECRIEGDIQTAKKNYDKALKYYNASILMAPHPISATANMKSTTSDHIDVNIEANKLVRPENSSGWGEFDLLSKAYEARVRLLFKYKQFEFCMRDINQVLRLGCPQATRDQLGGLQKACLKRRNTKLDSRKEKCQAFKYERPEPPTVREVNPSLPALSAAAQLTYNNELGRHIVAKRDIYPGEVVCVEESYTAAVTNPLNMTRHCTQCLRRTSAPLPCYSCSQVVFCSVACQKKGMTGSHWGECPILLSLWQVKSDENLTLAYRLLIRAGYSSIKKRFSLLESEAEHQDPDKLGFNGDGVYDGSDYRSIFNLVNNRNKMALSELHLKCLEACLLTKLLEKSGRFFVDSNGAAFTPSEKDLLLTGSSVLHHLLCLLCNTNDIYEFQVNVNNTDFSVSPVGCGVFPTVSLFNYSCNPSCTVLCHGALSVIKAYRFVPAGGALNLNHSYPYQLHPLPVRCENLKKLFYFSCTCDACENDWPLWDNMLKTLTSSEIPLKCVKCSQLIDWDTRRCWKCKLSYEKRMPVPGHPNLTTYNYYQVLGQIERMQVKYPRVKENFMKRGRSSDMEVEVILKMVELVTKYVVEPHPMYKAVLDLTCYLNSLADSVTGNCI